MFEWAAHISQIPEFKVIIFWICFFVVATGLIQNIVYAWSIPHAWRELNRHSQREDEHAGWETLRSQATLPISIIVPAYNEEPTIRESVMALLNLQYPDLRVIVVNDGSKDGTVDKMIAEFDMTETYLVRDTGAIKHKPIRRIYRSDRYKQLLFATFLRD